MLYAGLFIFHKEEESTSNQFVYFAEADDPGDAVELFKVGIRKMAQYPDLGIYGKIYLDSMVEIGKLPPGLKSTTSWGPMPKYCSKAGC